MRLSAVLGGLAGAATLTVINESVKKLDKNSPPMDLLGMNAVAKVVKGPGGLPLRERLRPVSVASDLLSSSLYFGLASGPNKKSTLIRGVLLGASAGVGAIAISKAQEPKEQPVRQLIKTRALTMTWYIIGGLIASAVINLFDNKK